MKQTLCIEQNLELKWQFTFDNRYKVSECKKIVNCQTNKIMKQCLNGYTVGYWFGKKFIAKNKLNNYIELIPNYLLPF